MACDEGALLPLNIDAVINSAYVVIGLLYGGGDFGRTLDISTRCGQDSDCNPASAGGILGTALGYDKIPAEWINPLKKAEDIKFAYTASSLTDTYRMSFSHALKMIERNGGRVTDTDVTIRCQRPRAVRFEQSFPGLLPDRRIEFKRNMNGRETVEGECAGMVFRGEVHCSDRSYVAEIEVIVDGIPQKTMSMPASFRHRSLDVYWNLDMPYKRHSFAFRWLNPRSDASIYLYDALLFKRAGK